jgi:prepilin-type N-terminal cleavage/methylation domain-containing protein
MKKNKKRAITLIEMMVVILIIGLISGVLAYNFKGSLDEGKRFKTEQGIEQVKNILMLEVAQGQDIEYVKDNWSEIIDISPLAGKPSELKKDGWNELYQVEIDNNDIVVTSKKYEQWKQSKKS